MKTKPDLRPHPTESELATAPPVERVDHGPRNAHGTLLIKRVLVPIDFSDCSVHALDYALALAERFEAKVILLHVVEPAAYSDHYLSGPAAVDETNQNLLQAGRERLDEVNKKRVAHRVGSEALVRIGRAHSEIPDTAKAMAADLIVLGTHGYTGLRHVLLGSTAERVVRQAPCPVLTVRLASPGPEPHLS
jgi:universal stress protein A